MAKRVQTNEQPSEQPTTEATTEPADAALLVPESTRVTPAMLLKKIRETGAIEAEKPSLPTREPRVESRGTMTIRNN